LLGKNSVVIVDEYIHRSVLDACKLAGARCAHFRHNDPEDLEKILSANPGEGKKLIIVEGVYSMHGDICPLEEIVRIKKEYGAHLMVDESHSLGVLGESGRGICEHAAVDTSCVDLITASLSKAFPANGGFVAGSRETIIFLQHQSATYMYSGALNPGSVSACRETLRVLGEEKWRVSKVKLNADRLRSGLKDLGYDTENSESPIIPIVTGAERPAVKLLQALYKRRVLASGALYPAVPRGCTRLRICASADQGDQYIDSLLEVFSECRKEL
jgi:7-keto-8-aminopelargonate synthetase-like enzyme